MNEMSEDDIEEVYIKYYNTVNMTASELESRAETDCSKEASDSRAPIDRNINILNTKKEDRTEATARSANRTISFVSRMKGAEQGDDVEGCDLSKRDISLKNWAYDPKKSNNDVLADEKSENSL